MAWRLERGRAGWFPSGFCHRHWGVFVQIKRDTLVAVCQLAGIGAAALILPCSLIHLALH